MSPKTASAEPHAADQDASPAWLRARRPEHKQERRDAIVAAAVELLDDAGLEATSLSAIARRAGLSKANCYRYFESREAILLAVILGDASDWSSDLTRALDALEGQADVTRSVDAFVETLLERPRLAMLMASLWSVLERNISVDAAAEFKRAIGAVMLAPADGLAAALPRLGAERATEFIHHFVLYIAGAWAASHPSPVVAEVLRLPEFEGMCLEFEVIVRAHATTLLHGLLAEA